MTEEAPAYGNVVPHRQASSGGVGLRAAGNAAFPEEGQGKPDRPAKRMERGGCPEDRRKKMRSNLRKMWTALLAVTFVFTVAFGCVFAFTSLSVPRDAITADAVDGDFAVDDSRLEGKTTYSYDKLNPQTWIYNGDDKRYAKLLVGPCRFHHAARLFGRSLPK